MLILGTYVRFDQKSMLNQIKQGSIFFYSVEGHFQAPKGHDPKRAWKKCIKMFAIHYNIVV